MWLCCSFYCGCDAETVAALRVGLLYSVDDHCTIAQHLQLDLAADDAQAKVHSQHEDGLLMCFSPDTRVLRRRWLSTWWHLWRKRSLWRRSRSASVTELKPSTRDDNVDYTIGAGARRPSNDRLKSYSLALRHLPSFLSTCTWAIVVRLPTSIRLMKVVGATA